MSIAPRERQSAHDKRRQPAGMVELKSPIPREELDELPSHERAMETDTGNAASWKHKAAIVGIVVVPMLGFIAAIVLAWQFGMMSPLYLGLLIGGWLLTGLGITVGYHRMLTHRSFDTHNWVRLVWANLGALAIEGHPLAWCAVHRKHHQHSDHDGDPHSPHLHGEGWWNSIKGFCHAHTGWLLDESWNDATLRRYVPDLADVPGMSFMGRHYLWWIVASLVVPGLIAGLVTWSWLGFFLGILWGGLARIFLTHHVTWSINSICHIFGSQEYYSGDDSRNNLLFGILSHGEGWHNNHHAFPTSARHGLKWWQFDLSWLVIRLMAATGLVWNVRTPSKRALESRQIR